MFAFSSIFTTNNYLNQYELDTINMATPLTNASVVGKISSYDSLVKPYGNLLDLFIGNVPGAMGEVSALLCLVGFIYLTLTKTIKWRIPVTYVSTVFLMYLIISRVLNIGIYYPLFNILSGGLMFGSIFMATDPVTSPVTNNGQVIFGLGLGILTVIFRYTGVEGVAISILIMNMLVFLIDKVGSKSRFNLMKVAIYYVIIAIVLLAVGIFIAVNSKSSTDSNFKIISKEKNKNEVTYIVTQKGYGGNIKAEIKIDGTIKSINILSHHETKDRYQLVMDNDYLNKLQESTDIDTISSATITSSALKKMIINVLEDYK